MNQPQLNPVPFANNGVKNSIPETASGGSASFQLGFPPLTMTPINQGGLPPQGEDFNGILNHLDSHIVWQTAGMGYSYNLDFANAIGGYPTGAVVRSADKLSAYVSTADSNMTDPDSPQSQNWAVWAGAKLLAMLQAGTPVATPTTTPAPTTPTPTPTSNTNLTWQNFALDNLRITALPNTDGLDFLDLFKFETLPAISGQLCIRYRLQNMAVTNFDDPNFKIANGFADAIIDIVDGVGTHQFQFQRPDQTGCPYLYILAWKNYANGMTSFPAALFDITKSPETAFLGNGTTNNTGGSTGGTWIIESTT